jgi:hypothetical protein
VYPDRIVEVSTGQNFFPTGGDLQFILVTCLDTYAKPPAYTNPVIGIYGDIAANVGSSLQPMQFGGGDAGPKTYRADWGSSTPMSFSVVGMSSDAKISGFQLWDKLSGTPWGGIASVRFEALRIEAQGAACVQTANSITTGGTVRIYDCAFLKDPDDGGAFGGFGYKWGIRGHGPVRWDIRNCPFVPVQEHCVYIDSPQGDSYIEGITHVKSGSTAIQVVNRAFDCPLPSHPDHQACMDAYESGANLPRPSGFGKLLIYDVTIGNLTEGQGGSGITVVGHQDDVWIKDISHVNTNALQHGSVVAWCDDNVEKGAHLWTHAASSQVYATKRAALKNITINVTTQNRDAVMLSAVGKLEMTYPWSISSNRTAFALDTSAGVGIFVDQQLVVLDGVVQRLTVPQPPFSVQNRDPFFYWPDPSTDLSAYPGFLGPGPKISEDGFTLSDAAIDARWPDPGVNQ